MSEESSQPPERGLQTGGLRTGGLQTGSLNPPRRRDEQAQRTQRDLPGATLQAQRVRAPDNAKDPMEFFVVHQNKLKKIRLLKDGGLTEVKP